MSRPQNGTPVDRDDDGMDGGMIDLEAFEAMRVDQEPEVVEDPDALPAVSDARRQELKDQARRRIEERLKARRRQRRLMRGGDLG